METKSSIANEPRAKGEPQGYTANGDPFFNAPQDGQPTGENDFAESGLALPASIIALRKRIGTPVWKLNVKRKWLVDRFLACNSLSLLIGEAGHGKSFVATQLAKSVAQGEDFLGCKVEQRPVLYVDGEMADVDVKARLENFGLDFNSPGLENRLLILGEWCKEPSKSPEDAEIIAFAKETHGLIIFDSLIAWHPTSENDSAQTRRYMKLFLHLAHTCRATVVVLHHKSNKSNDARAKAGRGTSDIPAVVDTTYNVTGSVATKRDGSGKLTQVLTSIKLEPGQKVRSGITFSAVCKVVDGKGLVACGTEPILQSEPSEDAKQREAKKQNVLDFLAANQSAGVSEVAKAIDESTKVARSMLASLKKDGRVETLTKVRKGARARFRVVAAKPAEKPFPDISDVPGTGPIQ